MIYSNYFYGDIINRILNLLKGSSSLIIFKEMEVSRIGGERIWN